MSGNEILGYFFGKIEEVERQLKQARNRSEADVARAMVLELHRALESLEGEIGELKRKLHLLSWRYRSLPVESDSGLEGAQPSAPSFTWADLASSTYMQKGWNRIAAGDYEGARELLLKAVEAAPRDVRVLSALGWAQTLCEEYDDALRIYQRVLAADPDNALAHVNVGYICLKKGIYGEAIEHLSKVVRSAEDRKATLYGNYYLGLVYLAREMHSDAVVFFEKAIELGPAMSEAYFQLGRTHYLAGQRVEAVAAWKRGILANQFDPWAKRCAEATRSVEGGQRPRFE